MSGTLAKWTARTLFDSIMTTGLNALANNGYATSAASPINNGDSANRFFYMDLELDLSAASSAVSASAARVDIYIIPAPGGTNFPTPPGTSAAATSVAYWQGSIIPVPSATFTRGSVSGLILPPCHFAIVLQNVLGVAFPATGNILRGWAYSEEGV